MPSNYLAAGRIIECNLGQYVLESYLIKGEWVLVSAADISRMREQQLKDAGLDPAAYFSFEKDPETITVIGWTGRPNSPGPG